MSKRSADDMSHYIDEKLVQLPPPPSERCIFKAPVRLHKENERAYQPEILSIGPYHHGKGEYEAMEEHKLRYLQQLLKRKDETSVDKYIVAIREMEQRARRCYAEAINLIHSNDFVKIMLLDGFFIIELLRKAEISELRDTNDFIFQLSMIRNLLRRDLLLLENQLPFFILVQLFNMTKLEDPKDDIITMSLSYLRHVLPHPILEVPRAMSNQGIKHLLGLVHDCWCSSFAEIRIKFQVVLIKWDFINSATELEEAGIQFKMVERRSLFDIQFKNGVLEIPPVKFTDTIETPLRNLIAYEQYQSDEYPKYVCDYICFMDCLINTSRDVELLRRNGIIQNWTGDDVAVKNIMNNLNKYIMVSSTPYNFSQVSNQVSKHYRRPWNAWTANLKRNYFNTPWASISFLGAVLLLLLAITQTVFSMLSYIFPRS